MFDSRKFAPSQDTDKPFTSNPQQSHFSAKSNNQISVSKAAAPLAGNTYDTILYDSVYFMCSKADG